MRKFTVWLVLIAFVAVAGYVAWPYAQLYRINRVLAHDDEAALARFIDLEAVRGEFKDIDWGIAPAGNRSGLMDWLDDQVRTLGNKVIDARIDVPWVRRALLFKSDENGMSFMDAVDHAFFEWPDRFLVRLGKLGDAPVHVRLSLRAGRWRITGIYL